MHALTFADPVSMSQERSQHKIRNTRDMRLLKTVRARRCYSILTLGSALALSFVFTPQTRAAFIGAYALNNFTLTNTDNGGFPSFTDGSVMSPNGGLSIVLTGGNSGSGLAGMTDLVINAAAAGAVQFQWSYSSLDAPGFDIAGYLLGSNFATLADTDGVSGSAMFTATLGQRFGFRVKTLDNQGEPGILTITDFSAPFNGSPVPEPATAAMFAVAAAAITAQRWQRWSNRRKKENA